MLTICNLLDDSVESYDFVMDFICEWPTPEKIIKASWEEIASSLKDFSNKEKKAKQIIKFSGELHGK